MTDTTLTPYGIAMDALERDFDAMRAIASHAHAAACAAALPGGRAPQPEPEGQRCLLELMGHRQCIGRLTEITFAGRPMLKIARIDGDKREQLYGPDSVYGLTWLSEDEAQAMAKPWSPLVPAALTTGPDPWADDDDPAADHRRAAAEAGLDNLGDEN